MIKNVEQALAFVEQHGIVLEAGRGSVPNLAEAIAGGAIKGSWWGHAQGKLIFRLTRDVRDSDEILVCRLIAEKITYVHKRLWPALVRATARSNTEHLARLREVHTASGAHKIVATKFPDWVPADVLALADRLSVDEARQLLNLRKD